VQALTVWPTVVNAVIAETAISEAISVNSTLVLHQATENGQHFDET
jgi:hypothetical protein